MFSVTFYSCKGGVGQTLSMLNVARILARSGRRVVVVDLDLEALGVGLSTSTGWHEAQAVRVGVSDFLLRALEGGSSAARRLCP